MASMRRVRKNFRAEVLRMVSAGDGNIETLIECAGRHFGRDVGYEVVLRAFLGSEVSNAVSCLRADGDIETIGKKWKPADTLTMSESQIVSTRRWKRLRGELKAEERFAHQHGLTDVAVKAATLLATIPDASVNADPVEVA